MTSYKLRDYPYRDEFDRLVLPLEDGTNIVCKGDYPLSIKWDILNYSSDEAVIVGNNFNYSSGEKKCQC